MDRNEAIKILKKYQYAPEVQEALECLHPELKESEDERIRKHLVDCLKFSLKGAEEQDAAGCSRQKDIEAYKWGIAYLEKQKEQNPTWSEKDEKMIGRTRGIIERYAFSQSAVDVNGELCEREFIEPDEWLKSLKERCTWRPTKQQMDDLEYIMKHYPNIRGMVNSIYADLKKLKG